VARQNEHLKAPSPVLYHTLDIYHRMFKFPVLRGGMHVSGAEHLQKLEGPAIVAYVHRDEHDPEYVGSAAMKAAGLQMRWLAKKEVYDEIIGIKAEDQTRLDRRKVALIRFILEKSGNYTIERGKDLEEAAAEFIGWVLGNNGVIAWSPEGHRNVEDGRDVVEAHLRGGLIMVAMEQGIPIIPAAVAGLLPTDPPGIKVVGFGEPIPIEKVSADKAIEQMREMRSLRKNIYIPRLREGLQSTFDQAYDIRDQLLVA
jgi:1-acyl-sn-glycerol-3-phosphate acyltransferase